MIIFFEKNLLLILSVLTALLMASGQIIWKAGMSGREINTLSNLIMSLFSPQIIIGIILYAFTTLLWLFVLNRADISYVYPILSLSYIFVLFFSMIILKEDVSATRWIGVLFILTGVIIITYK